MGDIIGIAIEVSGLVISLGGIALVFFQLKKMNEQLEYDKSVVKRQKAMDMAYEFSQLIEQELGYVLSVLSSDIGFQQKISKKEKNEYIEFDLVEESNIYGFSSEDVKKIMTASSYSCSILYQAYFNFFIEDFEKSVFYEISNHNFDVKMAIAANKSRELNLIDFNTKVMKTFEDSTLFLLNKLEWISMYFIQKLADEDIVYQSLHQTYLKSIEMLYFKIVGYNDGNGTDKYFTNIIALYVLWQEKKKFIDNEIIKIHKTSSSSATNLIMAKAKYPA